MLLDTCALLWLSEGSSRLSKHMRKRLAAASLVHVSAISAFEIGLKHQSGKLSLPMPPAEWFAAVVDHHTLTVHPLDWGICLAATQLPTIHKDPCDRFIIATARKLDLPIATSDPNFAAYRIEIIS